MTPTEIYGQLSERADAAGLDWKSAVFGVDDVSARNVTLCQMLGAPDPWPIMDGVSTVDEVVDGLVPYESGLPLLDLEDSQPV